MSSLQLLSAMVHDNTVTRTVFSWSNPTPTRPLGFRTLNPLPLTPLLPIPDSECYDYDLDCLANVARDFGVPVPRGGRSLAGFGKLDLLKQATPSASHIPSLSNPSPLPLTLLITATSDNLLKAVLFLYKKNVYCALCKIVQSKCNKNEQQSPVIHWSLLFVHSRGSISFPIVCISLQRYNNYSSLCGWKIFKPQNALTKPREVTKKKNGHKQGRAGPPRPWLQANVRKLTHFSLTFIVLILKTYFNTLKGLKNAFLVPFFVIILYFFMPLLYRYPTILWQEKLSLRGDGSGGQPLPWL